MHSAQFCVKDNFALDAKILGGYGRVMQTDLQQARKAAGVALGIVAGELGIDISTASRYLSREIPLPVRHVKPLARLLGIPVDDVLPPEDGR